LSARVEAGLEAIGGDALVVTHAGAMRAALALLLRLSPRRHGLSICPMRR
jgi:broad specificity phosphatase PhoE